MVIARSGWRKIVSLEKFMNLPTADLFSRTVAPLDEQLDSLDLTPPGFFATFTGEEVEFVSKLPTPSYPGQGALCRPIQVRGSR